MGEAQATYQTTTTKEIFTNSGVIASNYYDSTSLELHIQRPDSLYTEVRRKLTTMCDLDEYCEYKIQSIMNSRAFTGFLRGDLFFSHQTVEEVANAFNCALEKERNGNWNLFLNRELEFETPAAYNKN